MLLSNSQEGLQRCLTAYKKHGISENTVALRSVPKSQGGGWSLEAGRIAHPHHTPRHLHLKVTGDSQGAGAQEQLSKVWIFRLVTLDKICSPAFGEQFGGMLVYVCVFLQALPY